MHTSSLWPGTLTEAVPLLCRLELRRLPLPSRAGFVVTSLPLAHQGLNWQPCSLHQHRTWPRCLVPISQQVLAQLTDGNLASIFSVLGLLEEVFDLLRDLAGARSAGVGVSSLSELSAISSLVESRAAERSTDSAEGCSSAGSTLSEEGGPWCRPDMAVPSPFVAEIFEVTVDVPHIDIGGRCRSPDLLSSRLGLPSSEC